MTQEVMSEVLDIILKKCEKYNIKDKNEAIRTIGENLIVMCEICTFNHYKCSKEKHYEVIPVKKIEKKIEELRRIKENENWYEIPVPIGEYLEEQIEFLYQLIEENCEVEE